MHQIHICLPHSQSFRKLSADGLPFVGPQVTPAVLPPNCNPVRQVRIAVQVAFQHGVTRKIPLCNSHCNMFVQANCAANIYTFDFKICLLD
jgi:hypothetical protein